MDLIIHYGMHKTGTSSIQSTFAQLPHTQDFQYLSFGSANSSLEIIKAFSQNYRNKPGVVAQKLGEEELKKRTKIARENICSKLKDCSSRTVILSAEEIIQLTQEELTDLMIVLKAIFSNIKAVGYVRSPKSYVESVFQQRLKRSSQTMLLPKIRVNYRLLLEKFDVLFGIENVEMWNFEPRNFPNNCVVQDFCSRLGININNKDIQRTNEGLSRPAVQLLYIYRLFYENSKTNKLAKKLERLPGDKFYLDYRAYEQLAEIDMDGLVWLRDRTGINFIDNELEKGVGGVRLESEMFDLSTQTVDWLYKSLGKEPEIDLEQHDIKSIVGLLNDLHNVD